jgi:hypothetical protein
MTNLQALASKYRRALRNGTGCRLTHEELQALANIGTLETLQIAEARELQASWQTRHSTSGEPTARTLPAPSGSTVAPMANPPHGRSPGMTPRAGASGIAALVARP